VGVTAVLSSGPSRVRGREEKPLGQLSAQHNAPVGPTTGATEALHTAGPAPQAAPDTRAPWSSHACKPGKDTKQVFTDKLHPNSII
jgi:hypothetical protein